ncbi:MAG: hypothetical protein AABX59_01110, partial [Nanoarchaeota archaeon]
KNLPLNTSCGGVFSDVSATYWSCKEIEAISKSIPPITLGCVADDSLTPQNEAKYCPDDHTTRGQASTFFSRAWPSWDPTYTADFVSNFKGDAFLSTSTNNDNIKVENNAICGYGLSCPVGQNCVNGVCQTTAPADCGPVLNGQCSYNPSSGKLEICNAGTLVDATCSQCSNSCPAQTTCQGGFCLDNCPIGGGNFVNNGACYYNSTTQTANKCNDGTLTPNCADCGTICPANTQCTGNGVCQEFNQQCSQNTNENECINDGCIWDEEMSPATCESCSAFTQCWDYTTKNECESNPCDISVWDGAQGNCAWNTSTSTGLKKCYFDISDDDDGIFDTTQPVEYYGPVTWQECQGGKRKGTQTVRYDDNGDGLIDRTGTKELEAECPAPIPIPFFTALSVVSILLLISAYYFYILRKKEVNRK